MVLLKNIDKENDPKKNIIEKLKEYSEKTERNVICYYSNFLISDCDVNDIDSHDKTGFMNVIEDLEKKDGADIILHTPGGSISATEEIIGYLQSSFGKNIRTIVPQISMSGGTMLACTGSEILMGPYSNLGPVDPQIYQLSAKNVIQEFDDAKKDMIENPEVEPYYRITLGKYTPNFKIECEKSIEWSENILEDALKNAMFKDNPEKIDEIKKALITGDFTKNHSQTLSREKCKKIGLTIKNIEDNEELETLILSIHYAFISYFNRKPDCKIIINQNGNYISSKSGEI